MCIETDSLCLYAHIHVHIHSHTLTRNIHKNCILYRIVIYTFCFSQHIHTIWLLLLTIKLAFMVMWCNNNDYDFVLFSSSRAGGVYCTFNFVLFLFYFVLCARSVESCFLCSSIVVWFLSDPAQHDTKCRRHTQILIHVCLDVSYVLFEWIKLC